LEQRLERFKMRVERVVTSRQAKPMTLDQIQMFKVKSAYTHVVILLHTNWASKTNKNTVGTVKDYIQKEIRHGSYFCLWRRRRYSTKRGCTANSLLNCTQIETRGRVLGRNWDKSLNSFPPHALHSHSPPPPSAEVLETSL
jgi:hypothetical protein